MTLVSCDIFTRNQKPCGPSTAAVTRALTYWTLLGAGKMTEKVSEPFKDDGAIGKQFQDTEEGTAGVKALTVLSVWPPAFHAAARPERNSPVSLPGLRVHGVSFEFWNEKTNYLRRRMLGEIFLCG